MLRNNVQHDVKVRVHYNYYCIIISEFEISALLNIFPRFPKTINLPKIFLRSFENVGLGSLQQHELTTDRVSYQASN